MKLRDLIKRGMAVLMAAAMPVLPLVGQEKTPERNAYFGETHVHTSWSLGGSNLYLITGGRIMTGLEGTPIEVTVYKLGDKYYGARSNEFGYANYEITEALPELAPIR